MTLKHLLNKLIDESVHGRRPPKTLEQIALDECLHALVEGEFRLDKFVKYTLAPQLRKGKRRRRR